MKKLDKELFERQRFYELKKRLLTQEKALKKERHFLWLEEKESIIQEDTVWERLELFSTDILGYVSQIASKGNTSQSPSLVIAHLHQLKIFEIDCIIDWYSSEENNFPKIKQYFELLDYVRLLTLEYMEQFVLLKAS